VTGVAGEPAMAVGMGMGMGMGMGGGGNDGGMGPMLQMMCDRATKLDKEKRVLEERVAELEREKEEWEQLKASLITTLVD